MKKKLDFCCKYCNKKYNIEELNELGYVDVTKIGKVVTCKNPKCGMQQLIDENN